MVIWRKMFQKIYVVNLGETLKYFVFHKIVRVLLNLIENLTCCKFFVLKSDMF